jgi:DnaA family protein
MAQLPLALRLKERASFANFVAGDNQAALEHVRAIARGQRAESVWICGHAGTGKSHLLAAACREADEAGLRSMYLALRADADPAVLQGLEGVELLALDDIERVAGLAEWEAALFALIDARLLRGGLLAAARQPPRECGFALPDFVSRASAAVLYRLRELDDSDLLAALERQAAARGLELDIATADYLLQRVSRDLITLTDWLDRIDQFALASQRRITIPLVRRVLEEQDAGLA